MMTRRHYQVLIFLKFEIVEFFITHARRNSAIYRGVLPVLLYFFTLTQQSFFYRLSAPNSTEINVQNKPRLDDIYLVRILSLAIVVPVPQYVECKMFNVAYIS